MSEQTQEAHKDAGARQPSFYSWQVSRFYDYGTMSVDYESMEELSAAVTAARRALFHLTEKTNEVERKEAAAQTEYKRAWRRAYLSSNERTESARKARADLVCEDVEDAALVASQLKSEMVRACNAVRTELQTLQMIANNLRQQMRIEQ